MWEHTVSRVINHQRWLWERAQGRPLNHTQMVELNDLMELMLDRKASVSGRTLWLGGTDVAKNREASQFNCSFLRVNTIHDVVDAFWLLLQGCGVGFRAVPGVLSGFTKPVEIEVIRSKNSTLKGCEKNTETVKDGVWTIRLGDSAEAWAKSVGKILAQKQAVDKLVLDFSEIRAPGIRLRGYGWISSGDVQIHRALVAIAEILNRKVGQLLSLMDIHDIMNWLGSTLSSRRAAELSACVHGHPEWRDFAVAKRNWWEHNPQREQSNNSLLFYRKPSREELEEVFDLMKE